MQYYPPPRISWASGCVHSRARRATKYIDDLSVEERTGLLDKKVVAIDPNMSDLIYCIDDVDKTFRYTQNQRRKETKAKKYRDILQQSKKSTRVSGKTVAQWEAELSHVNKKTLRFDDFKKYIEAKNRISQTLSSFYEERIHRKLKLSGFINRRRSEQRMLTRFQKMFGSPDEVVIGFGDFEQAKHRKYHEPVKVGASGRCSGRLAIRCTSWMSSAPAAGAAPARARDEHLPRVRESAALAPCRATCRAPPRTCQV